MLSADLYSQVDGRHTAFCGGEKAYRNNLGPHTEQRNVPLAPQVRTQILSRGDCGTDPDWSYMLVKRMIFVAITDLCRYNLFNVIPRRQHVSRNVVLREVDG